MNNKLKAWLLMSPFILLVFLMIVSALYVIVRNIFNPEMLMVAGALGGIFLIGRLFKKGLDLYDQSECICTKTCDCQDPEGKLNGSNGGVCLKSNECPIHNDDPDPHPDCKVHNGE